MNGFLSCHKTGKMLKIYTEVCQNITCVDVDLR